MDDKPKIPEGQIIGETSAPEGDTTTEKVELNNTPVPEAPEPENPENPVSENSVSENPENVIEENRVIEENGVTEAPATQAEKVFTQSQVDDIAGKTRTETREKTFRYIYDRYGVNSEAELDDIVGNAQRYDSLQEEYSQAKKSWNDSSAARDKELADVKEQVALMQSGIDNARYDDARAILRAKGLEISTDNIANELSTHPEWKKIEPAVEKPNFRKVESKVSVLGNTNNSSPAESEEDIAMRMFKLK